MDNKKNIQGQQEIQGYRNQRSVSDTPKDPSLVAPKGTQDLFGRSISKKSERLATALYLVTNFLSDNEPLKLRLRSLSLELVQKAASVRYGSILSDRTLFEDTQRSISETLSLLELAFIAGIISEMNFTILKREYASLRDVIEVKKISRESRTDNILGDAFFGSSFVPTVPTPRPPLGATDLRLATNKNSSIGHYKGHKDIVMSDRNSTVFDKEKNRHFTPDPDPSMSIFNTQMSSKILREGRQARILKLIKDNREVSIKDIATHFPELSEKTIQRDLVSLTEINVLKKFGERRWSRYSVA